MATHTLPVFLCTVDTVVPCLLQAVPFPHELYLQLALFVVINDAFVGLSRCLRLCQSILAELLGAGAVAYVELIRLHIATCACPTDTGNTNAVVHAARASGRCSSAH